MPKVRVYKVKVYDISTDEWRISSRMATLEGAKTMKGEVLADTDVAIDDFQLEPGQQWTPKKFTA
jgi:hypothetical protein